MSAKSINTINNSISSISSLSCPSTFSSINNSTIITHLPVILPTTNTNNTLYLQQKTTQQSKIQNNYLYRNSWANLLSNLVENNTNQVENTKEKNTKYNNSLKTAINLIKYPWQNTTKPSSSTNNINDDRILPPPPYEERIIQRSNDNNYIYNQNTNKLIYFSGPAPFPLSSTQPAIITRPSSGHSSGGHSSIPSSLGQQQQGRRLINLRQSSKDINQKKRNRLQELINLWKNSSSCRLFCLAFLLLMIIALIIIGIITSHLTLPKHLEFVWIAPEQLRLDQSTQQPIHGRLDIGQLGKQARLELTGTPPFRSNFVSILDFLTNRIAIMDMSLRLLGGGNQNNQQKDSNRLMIVCFVIDLNRQNIPDLDEFLNAAKSGAKRLNQIHGWEQNWQFIGIPLNQPPQFQPEIAECKGARWVHLTKTNSDQKSQKCSECFDFCLPDWGIQKDVVRDENYLNILRQICFSLFVPEWRPFAQSPPLLGVEQQQQKSEIINLYNGQQQQNLPDMNNNNKGLNSGQIETKWISLHTPDKNINPIIDQLHLPSISSNGQFQSSSFQFPSPPNIDQLIPSFIGQNQQQPNNNNWMSGNNGYQGINSGKQQILSSLNGELIQKGNNNDNDGMQQITRLPSNSGVRQFWWFK